MECNWEASSRSLVVDPVDGRLVPLQSHGYASRWWRVPRTVGLGGLILELSSPCCRVVVGGWPILWVLLLLWVQRGVLGLVVGGGCMAPFPGEGVL